MAKKTNEIDRSAELLAKAETLRARIKAPRLKPANKQKLQKELVIICLEMSFGIVNTACKNAQIGRTTYYEWYNTDMEFREKCQEITESQIDLAEAALFKNIQKGDSTSIIFLLKYRGRDRGYATKTIVEGEINSTIKNADKTIENLSAKERETLLKLAEKLDTENED